MAIEKFLKIGTLSFDILNQNHFFMFQSSNNSFRNRSSKIDPHQFPTNIQQKSLAGSPSSQHNNTTINRFDLIAKIDNSLKKSIEDNHIRDKFTDHLLELLFGVTFVMILEIDHVGF